MKDIKMIVTDLDKTLLRSDKTISDYTADIFMRCRQRGIKVVFATARSENACRRFTDRIHPDAIISSDGALARIGGTTVYRAAMNIETVNGLLRACLKQPGVGYITMDTDQGYLVNQPIDENDPAWAAYLPAFLMDAARGVDCDAYKMTVEISDDRAVQRILSDFPTVDAVPFSGEGWYRFADKAANKWQGVKALAAHSNLDLKDIAAFGDDYSDIEILQNCGIGVAVSNAIDVAKAAADCICDTNDNGGVAKWMEANLL